MGTNKIDMALTGAGVDKIMFYLYYAFGQSYQRTLGNGTIVPFDKQWFLD